MSQSMSESKHALVPRPSQTGIGMGRQTLGDFEHGAWIESGIPQNIDRVLVGLQFFSRVDDLYQCPYPVSANGQGIIAPMARRIRLAKMAGELMADFMGQDRGQFGFVSGEAERTVGDVDETGADGKGI